MYAYHSWVLKCVRSYQFTFVTELQSLFISLPLSIFALNAASLPDPTSLLQFSRNLLALGVVGDSLSAMVTKAESESRELIYSAEEDMEGNG